MIPKIHFSDSELTTQQLAKDKLEQMLDSLEQKGCLHICNAYSKEQILRLEQLFRRDYGQFYEDRDYYPKALKVGNKRWMVTLKWKKAWLQAQLIDHPLLLPFLEKILGKEYILGSAGIVVAQPGSEQQHDHRDLPPLFDDHPLDPKLPCYALTMFVPFLDFNPEFGGTRVRVGSHRVLSEQVEELAGYQPEAAVGSCILMDYRIQHGGTANRSQQTRPLFYQVFTRPWFRDYRNFKRQPALLITQKSFHGLSNENRRLFRYAKKSWF